MRERIQTRKRFNRHGGYWQSVMGKFFKILNNQLNLSNMNEDEKKCPFCAEIIKIDAIKCKHCGEMLETQSNHNQINSRSTKIQSSIKKAVLTFVLIFSILMIVGALIVIFFPYSNTQIILLGSVITLLLGIISLITVLVNIFKRKRVWALFYLIVCILAGLIACYVIVVEHIFLSAISTIGYSIILLSAIVIGLYVYKYIIDSKTEASSNEDSFNTKSISDQNKPNSILKPIGLVFGILAAIGMLIGFIPLFGWLNWIVIPFSIVGLIISVLGKSKGGIVLCIISMFFGIIRLIIGGGVI